jgi:mycoredoxin
MSEKIMFYGSPVCGMVPPVRGVLDRAGASYEYVDISRDAEALQRVREINEGLESVPTLEFPDGSTLTEPALRELEEKLAALGLQARPQTWSNRLALLLESPAILVVAIGLALVGLLGRQHWLVILGAAILVLSLVAGWWRKRIA